jgi:hypothetical protein
MFLSCRQEFKESAEPDKLDFKFILLLAKDNKHQTLQPFIEKGKAVLKSNNIPKFFGKYFRSFPTA